MTKLGGYLSFVCLYALNDILMNGCSLFKETEIKAPKNRRVFRGFNSRINWVLIQFKSCIVSIITLNWTRSRSSSLFYTR